MFDFGKLIRAKKCSCENVWQYPACGEDGVMHDVEICQKCNRLYIDVAEEELEKAEQSLFGDFTLLKGYVDDPKAHGLRWITAHPHGGEGVPLLVHDNGEEYVVVGGAGGKLNQTVFKKPDNADGDEAKNRKNARKARKQEQAEQNAKDNPEWVKEEKEKANTMRHEAKERLDAFKTHVKHLFDDEDMKRPVEELQHEARKAARAKAVEVNPKATEQEITEFEDAAAKGATEEQAELIRQGQAKMLEVAAKSALGEDPGVGEEVELKTKSGKTVKIRLDPQTLNENMAELSRISALRSKANAIDRALKGKDREAIDGIKASIADSAPSQEDIDNYVKGKYLNEQGVAAQTALAENAESATQNSRKRNLTAGAADGMNAFTAEHTGKAIITPQLVNKLGIENAGRVTAAYLLSQGQDAGQTAKDLRDSLANKSYSAAKSTLDTIGQMDDIVKSAKDAAAMDDGAITKNQASIMAANMATQKYRVANICQGQLRAAGAIAHFLEENGGKDNMQVSAGNTAIAAHAFAKEIGLDNEDYSIGKGKGGYDLTINREAISKIAQPHTIEQHERNMAMQELTDDVAENGGQWRPEGLNERILLKPHQELMARAFVKQKRIVLNAGPGSGKTPTAYAAIADLLSTGKCDGGIMTMPAKPRSQQEDYVDTDGARKTGEKSKFLNPDMAKNITVVSDGADLKKKLQAYKDGKVKVLVMSPQMMREHVDEIEAAGLTGPKSFYIADEAHELATGVKDKSGSGMAQAFTKHMGNVGYAAAMSGTLLENDASELHSILKSVVGSGGEENKKAFDDTFGSAKQFNEEWQRTAHGSDNLFGDQSVSNLASKLGGSMISYHGSPTRIGEDGQSENVELHEDNVTAIATKEDRAKLAAANRKYDRDKTSDDQNVRVSAALVRENTTRNALNLSEAKLDKIMDMVNEGKKNNPGHKTIIHCTNLEPLNRIEARLKQQGLKSVRVTGAQDDRAVAENMKGFNSHDSGAPDVLLVSDAGNYGINAQSGDHVIMMAPPATPSKYRQLCARAFRIGREKDVRATVLTTDMPQERNALFRMKHIKGKQVDLLSRVAGETAQALASHKNEISEVAK